jgi:hypothetical protein
MAADLFETYAVTVVATMVLAAIFFGSSPDLATMMLYPLAIGAYEQTVLDMTAAYAAINNRGIYIKPTPFEEILGPEGQLLWSRRLNGDRGHPAVASDIADAMLWMMRQAGRYLPEYRATRAQAGDFLALCYNSELAAEVTLQPIRRYGFDAAILFADILLLPQAMGADLWFETGEGPRLSTITTLAGVQALKPKEAIHDKLAPIYETVRILARELPRETTLIGFAGAPWTVATYMIAGKGSKDQGAAHATGSTRDADADHQNFISSKKLFTPSVASRVMS